MADDFQAVVAEFGAGLRESVRPAQRLRHLALHHVMHRQRVQDRQIGVALLERLRQPPCRFQNVR